MIYTRADWERAIASGELTDNDVLTRLARISVHEFGFEGPAGYDEEGFVVSLIAEGLQMEGGVTLRVHTRDHPPPHVHIQRPGKPDVKINLETGELTAPVPSDVPAKKLRGFQAAVQESREILGNWWEKNHGTPVIRN